MEREHKDFLEEVDVMMNEQDMEIERLKAENEKNNLHLEKMKKENVFLLKEIDNEKMDKMRISENLQLEKDILNKIHENLQNEKEKEFILFNQEIKQKELMILSLEDEMEVLKIKINKNVRVEKEKDENKLIREKVQEILKEKELKIEEMEEKNKEEIKQKDLKITNLENEIEVIKAKMKRNEGLEKEKEENRVILKEKELKIDELEEKAQVLTKELIKLEKEGLMNQEKIDNSEKNNLENTLKSQTLIEKTKILEREIFEMRKEFSAKLTEIMNLKGQLETTVKENSSYCLSIHDLELKYSRFLMEKEDLINALLNEKNEKEKIISGLIEKQKAPEVKIEKSKENKQLTDQIKDKINEMMEKFSSLFYESLNKISDIDKKLQSFLILLKEKQVKAHKNNSVLLELQSLKEENLKLSKFNENLYRKNDQIKLENDAFLKENCELKQNKEYLDKFLQNSAKNFLDLEKKRDSSKQISDCLKEKLKILEEENKKKDFFLDSYKENIGFLQEKNVILYREIKEKFSLKSNVFLYFLDYFN